MKKGINNQSLGIKIDTAEIHVSWSCEPNNQLNVYTTSVTEGEVAAVKLV